MQLIKIHTTAFLINNARCDFIRPNFLMKEYGVYIKATTKKSTLGWHIEGGWVSYNQLKKAT